MFDVLMKKIITKQGKSSWKLLSFFRCYDELKIKLIEYLLLKREGDIFPEKAYYGVLRLSEVRLKLYLFTWSW